MSAPLRVSIPRPHPKQAAFVNSTAKRVVVKAGRRGGKTKGIAIRSVKRFLKGRRQLYAAPTTVQLGRYWSTVCRALRPLLDAGVLRKTESPSHLIEWADPQNESDARIVAMTAWNPDTLRGDFCDDLYLDEFQLMAEATWDQAGAPLLADRNGDAVFGFTPPSLNSRSASKAKDKHHASKFYQAAQLKEKADPKRWATFHFGSKDNPHISQEAIREMASDMTAISYRIEILAEDVDEAPGALWNRELVEQSRHVGALPDFDRVVVAVDPSASTLGNEAGIIGVGRHQREGYVLEDASVQGSPATWAQAAVNLYHKLKADCIVAEANNGGEMVALTIATADKDVKVKLVHASRGKATRAEPVAALFEVTEEKPERRGFFCGSFPDLEDELCLWEPGDDSPNRLDAMVWGFTELVVEVRKDRYSEEDNESYTQQSY